MASLDKEIKILMLKGASGTDGQDGKSSYDLAVEELHYSGTLEEWLESFSTPENYITRNEFKKVTQAEYDELEATHQLIPDCYYIITDDETYDELLERLDGIDETIAGIQEDITTKYNARVYTKEVMTATPDLSDTTGWTMCNSGDDINLDTLENTSDVLEVKGLVRKTGTVINHFFTFKVFDRGLYVETTHRYDSGETLRTIGIAGERILLKIGYGLNLYHNALEIGFSKVLDIDNDNPLSISDLEYKIISIKELVNY